MNHYHNYPSLWTVRASQWRPEASGLASRGCYFTLLPFLGLNFCHSDLFFHWSHFQGGVGNFTVTIDFFKSNAFREAYTTNDYPVFKRLSQNIYIQYSINTSNPDLVVRAETCRATPSNKPYDTPQYVFIADGWVRYKVDFWNKTSLTLNFKKNKINQCYSCKNLKNWVPSKQVWVNVGKV